MALTFQAIGLHGATIGSAMFKEDKIEWRDRSNTAGGEFAKDLIKSMNWQMVGAKGFLKVHMNDGSMSSMDGFAQTDYEAIREFVLKKYGKELTKESVSFTLLSRRMTLLDKWRKKCSSYIAPSNLYIFFSASLYILKSSSEGMNFGEISLEDKTIKLNSVNGKNIMELPMMNAVQAVVPQSNRDDLEIQFNENDVDKEADSLLQVTFHFPPPEVDEEGNVGETTPAQAFQTEIMNLGVIKSIKGNTICEFSKEMGNFVTPRGKYTMQMTSSYMHMQGQQYSYKIKYSDINALFLLDKPGDGLRMSFVICLDKPIRQGNQKYQHLVLETHKMEQTISLNLTEEEIEANESYKGQLSPEMTMSTASLIAKIFKVLGETTVFIPKAFHSFRNDFAVRCNVKTSEGLLYPLAKTMIFINKPTILAKYEDIDYIEFQRVTQAANSATRNFDMLVVLKKVHSGPVSDTQYMFSSTSHGVQRAFF